MRMNQDFTDDTDASVAARIYATFSYVKSVRSVV